MRNTVAITLISVSVISKTKKGALSQNVVGYIGYALLTIRNGLIQ